MNQKVYNGSSIAVGRSEWRVTYFTSSFRAELIKNIFIQFVITPLDSSLDLLFQISTNTFII